jgi:hypothetical protein
MTFCLQNKNFVNFCDEGTTPFRIVNDLFVRENVADKMAEKTAGKMAEKTAVKMAVKEGVSELPS